MQAIDLLAEVFYGATIKVIPRPLATPGTVNGLRHGQLGRVQGFVIGEGGKAVVLFECNNATMEVSLDGAPAVEALKALNALPCVFPEELRRKDITREKVTGHNRDGADLNLLARMGNGSLVRGKDED